MGSFSRVRKGLQVKVEEEEAAGLRRADLWIAGRGGVTYRGLSRTWISMHFQNHTKWAGFTSDHCCHPGEAGSPQQTE